MSSNKKTIILTIIICAITLVLAYLICLNISYECFDLKWFSNTFQLNIVCGIFASSAVVMLCDIQKYSMNKRTAENGLWSNTQYLYIRITVIKHKIEDLIKFPFQPVTKKMFDESRFIALNFLNAIYSIDYSPFSKKNTLLPSLLEFQKSSSLINSRLDELRVLDIAINEELIKRLQNNPNSNSEILAEDPQVMQTLKKLHKGLEESLGIIEKLLKEIDYSGRYNYKNNITTIKEKSNDLKEFNFEEYLK